MLYILYHDQYYNKEDLEVIYRFESESEGQIFFFEKYGIFLSYAGLMGIVVDSKIDDLKPINDGLNETWLQIVRTSIYEENEDRDFDSYPSVVKHLLRTERINSLL